MSNVNSRLGWIAGLALLGASALATPAKAQTYWGQVGLFGANFCPSGWLPADGAQLSIAQYTVLFSLLGTTYGGDGVRVFNLPKVVVPTQNGGPLTACVANQGTYPPRARLAAARRRAHLQPQ